MTIIKTLDFLNIPINGINLIEANAGTGKTYNLIIIYLRLLLNLYNPNFNSKPLTVKNILVVTFTKSAIQDFRIRVIENIRQFRQDCIKGYSQNQIFSELLSKIKNIKTAISLLSEAERNIATNQQSIFTIHSFCQKIITENALELNIFFNTSIIENESALYKEICYDFWRRHFYLLPLNITSFILQYWKNPEELLKDIFPYIYKEIPKFQYPRFIQLSGKQLYIHYNQIINCINSIKKQWIVKQNDIINIIDLYDVNRKIYNKKRLQYWIYNINQWTKSITHDHIVPNNLKHFRESVLYKHGNSKINYAIPLFHTIEELYQRLSSLKELIFNFAIQEIRQYLDFNKHYSSKITFNDLINLLLQHGINQKNNKLFKKIALSYPIAIIDEFQDTDSNQYKIFHTIYSNHIHNSLILIGDPKQAIYSFRGADIFTYITAKQSASNTYHLNINWRSSPGMVKALNQLFNISNPFVYKDIPFVPSLPAKQNDMYQLFINNQIQPSICFWLNPSNHAITIHDYKKSMATECAVTLQNLLYHIHHETAWIKTRQHEKKILQHSDIVILVRNHEEAFMIKTELLKKNIPIVFLSNRINIFKTIESYELLLLLKAILFPTPKSICTALTTIFFGISNIVNIEKINKNINTWEKILTEFSEYHLIWKQYNILSMIQKILFKYKVPETLLNTNTGAQNLTNILHLGELLNNTYQNFKNEYDLIKWLELQITQSTLDLNTNPNYMLRSYNLQKSIKISTIHKSKGLEFPLTFLPFIASFHHYHRNIIRDPESFELYLNFDDIKLNSKSTEEERLSEDLRLLYVAISRSVYYCAIGIAPIIYKRYKKTVFETDLHKSAIGYLIQNKKSGNSELLKHYLKKLHINTNGNITFRTLSKKIPLLNNIKTSKNKNLIAKTYRLSESPMYIRNNAWNITSYSNIKDSNIKQDVSYLNFLQKINIEFIGNSLQQNNKIKQQNLTQHTFLKGKECGIFFHSILQTLNFQKFIDRQWLQTQMIKHNIDHFWEVIIWKWLYNIINTPIDQRILNLSKISNYNKKTEFRFCLTINNNLCSKELDILCKKHDPLSSQTTTLNFPQMTGMLQGFIDLIFYWNYKYYLLDYKTDWLGENNSFYSKFHMESNIIKHHYTLQYQLYTLALHRFLRYKIKFYDYEKNFGGIYYLFIRGMDGKKFNNGVYFCRPTWKFIEQLDKLFSKSHNDTVFIK